MAIYNTIPADTTETPLIAEPKPTSRKSTAVIAAICMSAALAGTQPPRAVTALTTKFSVGDRLLSSEWKENSGKSMCLAVSGNANVDVNSDAIIYDCNASGDKGKSWKFNTKKGLTQIEYTGPTVDNKKLCLAGQKADGTRKFGSGSQFYLWNCVDSDSTQQFLFEGRNNRNGQFLTWQYDTELCLDAKNNDANGDVLVNSNPGQAYECKRGDDKNQKWAKLQAPLSRGRNPGPANQEELVRLRSSSPPPTYPSRATP